MPPAMQNACDVHLDGTLIPTDVRTELEAILTSEAFRGSLRCQSFLRHIVEAVYAGTADALKERTLGIELFGRHSDYDTGADAIVRVTALETRRRLARYHQAAAISHSITITLTPGTYVPTIHECSENQVRHVASAPGPIVTISGDASPGMRRRLSRLALTAITVSLLLVGIVLTGLIIGHARNSVVANFWMPEMSKGKAILCTSKPNAYAIRPTSIAMGDSNLALQIQENLSRAGQATRMAIASDLSESDLREAPVVLIGSSGTNLWTAKLTNDLRFHYAITNGRPFILDRRDHTRMWEVSEKPDTTHATFDYAIITRLLHSQYGPGVISIAGSSSLSTHASGVALFSRDSLTSMLRNAPDDWPQKNLQLVICYRHEQTVDYAPQVVAAVYW